MNKHEIFAKVKAHLLRQGTRSMSENDDGCAYRGQGGLSCAVGCLIPDDAYSSMIENHPADYYLVQQCLPFEVTPEIERLLRALQGVHDDTMPTYWEMVLSDVARNFNIEEPTS